MVVQRANDGGIRDLVISAAHHVQYQPKDAKSCRDNYQDKGFAPAMETGEVIALGIGRFVTDRKRRSKIDRGFASKAAIIVFPVCLIHVCDEVIAASCIVLVPSGSRR